MNKDYSDLNILIIGLGSISKRRIMNLKANGIKNISGFDIRSDRIIEARSSYGIFIYEKLEEALQKSSFNAWIISVPPDIHHIYLKKALDYGIPAFIEAS